MTIGSVTQKLRPLRIAFMVNPAVRSDVLYAIQLSSVFWGGIFNPIVPCFKGRLPVAWSRESYRRVEKAREITDGYLDAFDPDIIVPVSEGLSNRYSLGNREVVEPSELLGGLIKCGSPNYGVGAIELVQHLAEAEFKFVRKTPLKVVLPVFFRRNTTFFFPAFLGLGLRTWRESLRVTFKNKLAYQSRHVQCRDLRHFFSLSFSFHGESAPEK